MIVKKQIWESKGLKSLKITKKNAFLYNNCVPSETRIWSFFTGVIPISEFFYNKHDVATKYFTFITVLSK